MDRRIDGGMHACMGWDMHGCWVDAYMDVWMDACVCACMEHVCMHGWMHGCMGGYMHGCWMDAWMDGDWVATLDNGLLPSRDKACQAEKLVSVSFSCSEDACGPLLLTPNSHHHLLRAGVELPGGSKDILAGLCSAQLRRPQLC